MLDASQALAPTPSRHQVDAISRSKPLQVTGRLRKAISAMVWQALKRADAATFAGMTDHSVREALRRPHVMAYYRSECEVLRKSTLARNIQTLEEVRDQPRNAMARVQAVKALEQLGDNEPEARARQSLPGMTVVVVIGAADGSQARVIDHDASSGRDGSTG